MSMGDLMTKPFATRRSRQAGLFIGFWIYSIASIVVSSTTQREEGLREFALVLGRVYTQGHRSLTEFAATATIPEWVPLFLYFILANLGVLLSLFLLEVYTLDETHFGFIEGYFYSIFGGLLLLTFGVLVFFPVVMTANLMGGTISIFQPVARVVRLVLDISPQALVLSGYLVAITLFTSFIP